MTKEDNEIQIDAVLQEVKKETIKAKNNYSDYKNAHEGYAVLLEEVDELWDNVKLSQKKHPERDAKIYLEAKQVAAVAVRIMIDCFLNNVPKEENWKIRMDGKRECKELKSKVYFCPKCGKSYSVVVPDRCIECETAIVMMQE